MPMHSRTIEYRIGRAQAKWRAAGCELLGIPEPKTYTQVNGDEGKQLYSGPDGLGEWAVVREGAVLFTSASRAAAWEFYDRIK